MNHTHGLTYDSDRDLFLEKNGAEYVECRFETSKPVMIRVDGDVWTGRHNGFSFRLDWTRYLLPSAILQALRVAAIYKLKKNAPTYMTEIRSVLHHLEIAWGELKLSLSIDFDDLDLGTMLLLQKTLPPHNASTFRTLYRTLAIRGLEGCSMQNYGRLSEVRLERKSGGVYGDVRRWDVTRGALTTSELEHFRAHLVVRDANETVYGHFTRVYLRTAVAVGKRATQLLHALPDALRSVPGDSRYQKFILLPGGKGQRNEKPAYWPIGEDLYDDLVSFASRPEIVEAQARFGYFFVTPVRSQSRINGPRHVGPIQTLIRDWIQLSQIISPRTGEILEVTTTRLRHTVATQMAKKGYSKGDIQAMLEHLSETAALAYLDAVGNDLTPAIERVDEALGGVFSNLSNAFFKGTVIDRPEGKLRKPVVRPDPLNIAIVGECGSTTACPKHPFFSCYNGCPYFLKFKDTDEDANRAFVEKEYQRWRNAEPSATHSKALDDFARLDRAMQEADERGKPE
jgi:hypothetical protein